MKKALPIPGAEGDHHLETLALDDGRPLHVGVVGHLGGFAQCGRKSGGQIEIVPGLEQVLVHGRARALLADEVRRS